MDTESRNTAAAKHQEVAQKYAKCTVLSLCLCWMTLCVGFVMIASFSAIWWIIVALALNASGFIFHTAWVKHDNAAEALSQ